jgi:hypothetical protein
MDEINNSMNTMRDVRRQQLQLEEKIKMLTSKRKQKLDEHVFNCSR